MTTTPDSAATPEPQPEPAKTQTAPRRRSPRKASAASGAPKSVPAAEQPAADAAEPAPAPTTTPQTADGEEQQAPKAPARKRAPRKATAKQAAPDSSEDAGESTAKTQAPAKTRARAKTTTTKTDQAAETSEQGAAEAAQDGAAPAASEEPKPARKTATRTRRTAPKQAAATEPPADAATDAPDGEPTAPAEEPAATEEPAAPVKARRATAARSRTKKAAPTEAPDQPAATPSEESAPAETSDQSAATKAADAGTDSPAEQPAPRRSRRPARTAEQKVDVLAAFSAAEPAQQTADAEDEEDTEEEAAEDPEVRLPATALLFQAPDPSRGRRVQAPSGPPPAGEASDEDDEGTRQPRSRRRSGRGRQAQQEPGTDSAADDETTKAPDVDGAEPSTGKPEAAERSKDETASDESSEDDDGSDDQSEDETGSDGGQRRRRRRGGRGRRNRGSRESGETDAEDATEDSADDTDQSKDESGTDGAGTAADEDSGSDDDSDSSSSRRRRRRRRSGGGSRDDGTADSREGRAAREEITALKGSTRLEAKRQRRRDGRDAGRRRTTITEAEFLARREAVDRSMVVREFDGRIQIAVLEDDVLVEHYVAQEKQSSMVGNVYLGRVQNVLPSMEAAFIDLGKGRNAVLYAGEVNWDAAGMKGQPRRIEQALSSGDSVLVQVTKDPIGHKGARLTSQVTLAGRYLVYVPSGAMTGISRKLPENERARLKKLLKEIVPEGAGVIVRTAAEGATEDQLRADVERLTAQWEEIQAKSKSAKSAPVLLKGEPELAVRVVRDVFNEDFRSLVVSGDGAWQTISSYVRELSPDLADRMHHWTDTKDVFAAHRIDEQLAKGMDRKVYLPSGGSLVIDRTEAMTVVDVNTGKFVGSGGTLEETVTKNNLEAAEEVVRQLRLRDIGGIIVIDFIDMVLESNRDLVMRRLVECLGRDRTRHQVAEVTSLGLVQMTRKRVGQGLVEAFSDPCEHCGGRGYIVHDQPVDKGGSSSGNGEGGGRRRGRRGGAGGGRQEDSPAPVVPAEDPQAVAAREAVKATLATIAAAAEKAHSEEPTAAGSAAESAQSDQVRDETPGAAGGADKPPATERAADEDQTAEPAAKTPSSLEELAAALPAGRSAGEQGQEQDTAAQESDAAAQGQGTQPQEADAGSEEAQPATSRKRRPRRVTSGGPITA